MTSHQWRSSTARKAQRSNSTESLRHVRHNLSSVVPSGTVASRVSFLENRPIPPHILPRHSTPKHTHSRAGFGRRMTSRFGRPATRNGCPDQDPTFSKRINDSAQIDTEHSYLGLNSIRTTHLHEHGITDGGSDRRDTYNRASGIHSQMQPQGLTERVQYDAASPWSVAPKQHKSTCWRRNEMDDPEEIDGSGKKSYFKGLASIFPTLTSGIGHSDMHSRNVKSRQDNTMKSDFSALTTSTVRRQSVRDLFDEHGIERPYGLVPDKEIVRDNTHKLANSQICCHNCSWYNHESSNWCVKCKMVLRSVRHKDSPSLISPKGEPNYAKNAPEEAASSSPDSSGKENHPTINPKKQDVSARPEPAPLHILNQILRPVGGLSNQTTIFPLFNVAQSPPKSQMMSRKTTLAEQPLAPTLLKGSRKTTLVKDSPFLIADQLSTTRSSRCFPLMMQGDSVHCPQNRSKRDQYRETKPTLVDCESLACLATHEDHKPYRHSVTCSGEKRHMPEETDNGYVADTSFAEDLSNILSVRPHKARSHISKQNSTRSLKSRNLEASHQSMGSEYVECRGYPRTGHGRHGSANSGALGQCQHCIDDCQCTSCQNTHHSVRCCLNENHQGMVHHHHHLPRAHQPHNPLDCPAFSSQNAEISKDPPPASSARTASTIVAPALQPATPLPPRGVSRVSIHIEPPTKKTTMETPRSIPRSKRDTFLKEAAHPPTPPTWVSNPKLRTKAPSLIQPSKLQPNRAAADTALDVKATSDPPPPFKERPTLPPDLSSPEQNRESTVGTWVKTLPDPVQEQDNFSCNIPSCNQCESKEKQPRLSSVRNPWRDSKTLTQSSIASRNISELLRFREKNTVPLLNQKLLEHQEELRKIEKQCDEMTEALARSSAGSSPSSRSGPIVQTVQPKAADREGKQKFKSVERETSMASSNENPTAKKRGWWGLALVDKKPTPPCCTDLIPVQEHRLSEDTTVPCNNDPPVQEHLLRDDPIVDEMGNEKRNSSVPKALMDSLVGENGRNVSMPKALVDSLVDSITKIEEHECIWKARFAASKNDNLSQRGGDKDGGDGPLKGLTVVVHMEGKEDLVIEADLRKGSMVKAKAKEKGAR